MYQFPESAPFASPKHNTRPEWKKDDHHRSAKLAMSAKLWITDVPCQRNSNSPIYDPRSRRSHKLANISNRTTYWGFLTPLPSKSLDAKISLPHPQCNCGAFIISLSSVAIRYKNSCMCRRLMFSVAKSRPGISIDTLVCHCRTISFFIVVNRWWRRLQELQGVHSNGFPICE